MPKQAPRGPASVTVSGIEFVTLSELSRRSGRHLCHLVRLVKQGRLSQGFKHGKIRYVPAEKSLVDLSLSPTRAKTELRLLPWE